MSVKGFVIAEEGHVVNILPPIDITGGVTCDSFKMENYGHVSIVVQFGVTASAATKILVYEQTADGVAGTAIAHNIYKEETASGDTLGTRTAVTSAGTTPSANDNIFYVIEIDASELTDGSEWISVQITAPAASILCSATAYLSGSRYGQESSATAIA